MTCYSWPDEACVVLQLCVPASREMLRELPVVMWLQVIVIISATLHAAWKMRGAIQKRASNPQKLRSSTVGEAHLEQQVQLPAHMLSGNSLPPPPMQ